MWDAGMELHHPGCGDEPPGSRSNSTSGQSTPWASLQRPSHNSSIERRRQFSGDDDEENAPTPVNEGTASDDFEWVGPTDFTSRQHCPGPMTSTPPVTMRTRSSTVSREKCESMPPTSSHHHPPTRWESPRRRPEQWMMPPPPPPVEVAAPSPWAGYCGSQVHSKEWGEGAGAYSCYVHGGYATPPPPPPALTYRTFPSPARTRSPCCCGNSIGTGWYQFYHCCPESAPMASSWISRCKSPSHLDYGELQDKVAHLEADKENLSLQISVLSDQVDAQKEKIAELESALCDKKGRLEAMECQFQQEVMLKKKIEADRLELMTDVPALKLRLVTAEREKHELDTRLKKMEADVVLLRSFLAEREAELLTSKSKSSYNGSVSQIADLLHSSPTRIIDSEIEDVRKVLESTNFSVEEKEKRIEDLREALVRYSKLKELVQAGQLRKSFDSREGRYRDKSSSLHDIGSEKLKRLHGENKVLDKPPAVPRTASTPPSGHFVGIRSSTPTSVHSMSLERANSDENMVPQRTPPPGRNYSTVPRNVGHQVMSPHDSSQEQQLIDSFRSSQRSRGSSGGVSFGKGVLRLKSGKRSCSAPELAQPELVVIHPGDDAFNNSLPGTMTPPLKSSKNRGLKKIFGKLKRSNSHTMDVVDTFQRGGMRATAGPRLCWTPVSRPENLPDKPFAQWDAEVICDWLNRIGLGAYSAVCKQSVKDGSHLIKASSSDLEKDLGIKNPLHRKKLLLAVESMTSEASEMLKAAGGLDWQWMLRWLDDVGLPQYKDSFSEAKIDGRVLNFLTVDDLLNMKITNQLHHISMKRGIQVLRLNHFDPSCLKRRSVPEEQAQRHTPLDVSLWTNHRVMEWLRTVDLSEYAPNLRGSGVHGALLVYEDEFTSDLFARLLNIPPSKTLLRRHLNSQFKQLVGSKLMQRKRALESASGHIPLSPSAKIKASRKSQFSLKWKKSKLGEGDTYVCPMDMDSSLDESCLEGKDGSWDESQSPVKQDGKTSQEIEAVSSEISSFMDKLQDEKALSSLTTTNL